MCLEVLPVRYVCCRILPHVWGSRGHDVQFSRLRSVGARNISNEVMLIDTGFNCASCYILPLIYGFVGVLLSCRPLSLLAQLDV